MVLIRSRVQLAAQSVSAGRLPHMDLMVRSELLVAPTESSPGLPTSEYTVRHRRLASFIRRQRLSCLSRELSRNSQFLAAAKGRPYGRHGSVAATRGTMRSARLNVPVYTFTSGCIIIMVLASR